MAEQNEFPGYKGNINDSQEKYVLQLFITGASQNSTRAVTNIKAVCDTYLNGNYELDVIDVYQQPLIVENEQIIALPLLIKKAPLPVRRLIGDMSDTARVLKGLGVSV